MCCKLDIYKRKWYGMPNMNEHRANSGSMVINKYLYAFGGFQTQSYGQIGVDSIERLDLKDPKGTWKMVKLATNSGALGKKACFYLIDISEFLKKNSHIANKSAQQIQNNETVITDQTIMFIGGWSKATYLLEVDCFYP